MSKNYWNPEDDDEMTDWKAVTGHVEHFIEQGRIEDHFGKVQDERRYGEVVNE